MSGIVFGEDNWESGGETGEGEWLFIVYTYLNCVLGVCVVPFQKLSSKNPGRSVGLVLYPSFSIWRNRLKEGKCAAGSLSSGSVGPMVSAMPAVPQTAPLKLGICRLQWVLEERRVRADVRQGFRKEETPELSAERWEVSLYPRVPGLEDGRRKGETGRRVFQTKCLGSRG